MEIKARYTTLWAILKVGRRETAAEQRGEEEKQSARVGGEERITGAATQKNRSGRVRFARSSLPPLEPRMHALFRSPIAKSEKRTRKGIATPPCTRRRAKRISRV